MVAFSDQSIEATGSVWERWLQHPWTEALFAGELSDAQFRYWLVQDLPYLGQHMTEPVYPKVPPHLPFIALSREYAVRAETTRVELATLGDYGVFAKTRCEPPRVLWRHNPYERMFMTRRKRYSPETRERAVRMVVEHRDEYRSEWKTIFRWRPRSASQRVRNICRASIVLAPKSQRRVLCQSM